MEAKQKYIELIDKYNENFLHTIDEDKKEGWLQFCEARKRHAESEDIMLNHHRFEKKDPGPILGDNINNISGTKKVSYWKKRNERTIVKFEWGIDCCNRPWHRPLMADDKKKLHQRLQGNKLEYCYERENYANERAGIPHREDELPVKRQQEHEEAKRRSKKWGLLMTITHHWMNIAGVFSKSDRKHFAKKYMVKWLAKIGFHPEHVEVNEKCYACRNRHRINLPCDEWTCEKPYKRFLGYKRGDRLLKLKYQ